MAGSRIEKETKKRLKQIESKVRPGEIIVVYVKRGDVFIDKDGREFLEKDIPAGENIKNILVVPATEEAAKIGRTTQKRNVNETLI